MNIRDFGELMDTIACEPGHQAELLMEPQRTYIVNKTVFWKIAWGPARASLATPGLVLSTPEGFGMHMRCISIDSGR